MRFFSRKKRTSDNIELPQRKHVVVHLREFVETREGVEAYFETETPRESAAILCVARSGEWTRRRVNGIKEAVSIAHEIGVPLYEIVKVGYPESMRHWNATHRS